MKEVNIKIGKRIKETRLKKQLQQNEFSKLTGIAATKLSDYERDIIIPSVQSLVKIASVLDVTVDYLIFGKLDEKAKKEITDKELFNNFSKVNDLPDEDKKIINYVIKSILLASKINSVNS